MLRIFTACVGDRYSLEYVQKLAAAFRRHLQLPFAFYCATDREPLPDVRPGEPIYWIKPRRECWGWWNLEEAYSNPWWARELPILYVGLDTIIRADITPVIKARMLAGRLTLLRDFSELIQNDSGIFSGTWADGVAFVPAGGIPALWDAFLRSVEPESRYPMHVWNTQILRSMGVQPDLWQEVAPGLVCSFKWPVLKEEEPEEPIVCFHGDPRPHAVTGIPWVEKHWV